MRFSLQHPHGQFYSSNFKYTADSVLIEFLKHIFKLEKEENCK